MQWPKVQITTPHGVKSGIAPAVISASRSTDIPAFHAKWFMQRIKAGYCVWENPFNAKPQYISFENCKVIVFWTKNPLPLIPYLSELKARGFKYYFQYTLNDYVQEALEPHLPSVQKRIQAFQTLTEHVGKECVIWRFDPIILGDNLPMEKILHKYANIAEHVADFTTKSVFSFVDIYKKTASNLKKIDASLRAPTEEEAFALAKGIVHINKNLGSPLRLATCAESLSLLNLGIEHNKCIDPDVLFKLCPEDSTIQKICGKNSAPSQGSLIPTMPKAVSKKDAGQRTPCGCAPSKDIGSYNTCMHFCSYCYANQSEQAVKNKVRQMSIESEKL